MASRFVVRDRKHISAATRKTPSDSGRGLTVRVVDELAETVPIDIRALIAAELAGVTSEIS